jgi:hypothetical protein
MITFEELWVVFIPFRSVCQIRNFKNQDGKIAGAPTGGGRETEL